MTVAEPSSSRYWLNRALFDLNQVTNRDAFMSDKMAYISRYCLTESEREALTGPCWRALLDHGALPNLVFKYYMVHGLNPAKFADAAKSNCNG